MQPNPEEDPEVKERAGKLGGSAVAQPAAVPVTGGAQLTNGAKITLAIGAVLVLFTACTVAIGSANQSNQPAAVATTRATPKASPTPSPTSKEEVRKEEKTEPLSFTIERVADSLLEQGKEELRRQGTNGEHKYTYEVTYVDGKETSRKLVGSEVAKGAISSVIVYGTKPKPAPGGGGGGGGSGCDPNYSGCVPIASDVDCAGGNGNGPAYVAGPVRVIGSDIYDLDRDGNGIGCE